MIKDPLHQIETPYEILDVDPNSSHNKVHQALPKFMHDKRNLRRLTKAMDASKSLKNPLTRISIDILYYCIGKIEDKDFEAMDIDSSIKELLTVPHLENKDLYSDLKKRDFPEDFREIKFRSFRMSDLNKYDDIDLFKLEMPFDQ